jgi:hypothetical protein
MKSTVIVTLMAIFLAAPIWATAQSNPTPKGYKLKKDDDYKKYEQDVLKCIDWFDSNPINKYPAIRQEVQLFLINWHQGTPYVSIMVGDMAVKSAEENPSLVITYMNGWSQYVIEGGDEKDEAAALLATMNHVLDTYQKKENGFEKSKYLISC